MVFTRKLNLMLVAICCMTQVTQATNELDENDRTELMSYIIEKEAEIKIKKSEVEKIWNKYFYQEKIVSGYSTDARGNTSTSYKYIPLRKIYTTDVEVAEYRIIEDEFNLFVDNIIENIKIMVFNGADLQARDVHGKTVRDYCCTNKIDKVLRNFGAPTSLYEDDCEIIGKRIVGTIVVGLSFLVVMTCYIACHPRWI